MNDADRARAGYSQRKLTDPTALAIIRQREAEQRALAAMDVAADAQRALRARAKVTEPRVYGPGSPHSWFVDLYKAERGQIRESLQRLDASGTRASAVLAELQRG